MIHSKIQVVIVVVSLLLAINGCVSAPVRTISPSDRVRLNYTCRLADGSIAATTQKEIDTDPVQRKSALYMVQNPLQPFELIIGEPEKPGLAGVLSFEQEITMRLATKVIGIPSGEKRKVELVAETVSNLPERDRYLDMARIRKRPKEMNMSIDEFRTLTGTTPQIGGSIIFDPMLPGRITSTDDGKVTLKFAPDSLQDIVTPFGPAALTDAGDHYAIELQVKKGQLIRSGPLAGIISAVKDDSFTIDYGNPFAGERLQCDVTADLASVTVKEADKK